MNAWDRQNTVASNQATAVDQGLRSHMLKVYNYMASGVLLSAVLAYLAGTFPPLTQMLVNVSPEGKLGLSGLGLLVSFAPLAMAFFMMFKLRTMSTQALNATFWAYAALMGLSMFTLFLTFTGESIIRVFFITAGTFGLLSMYGYTTKKDLTSWGSFLIVGVIAVLIVSVVNMFLQSSALQMAMSYVGVLLALGLTAYDTQKVKEAYYMTAGNEEAAKRASILGALSLYFDFIYLFINLVQIMGSRR